MIEFAVRRWQFTLVMLVALLLLGVQSLVTIPKAEDPTFPGVTFSVAVVLPGGSPKDLEKLVVDPLETKLKALEHVKSIKSQMDDGLAVLIVEFDAGLDADRKRDEVLRETNAARPSLPAEVVRLDVMQFNAARVNVREVALVSATRPFRELEDYARGLRRRLESLHAVEKVDVAGLVGQEVNVELDLEKLRARGLSVPEITAAIGAESSNVPAGSVEVGSRRLSVKTSGDYTSVDEVRNTVLRMGRDSGGIVRLGDVAAVSLRDAEATQLTRWNGTRAVLIAAAQRDGENVFETGKAIEAELDEFAKTLPEDVQLARGFDQSKNVGHRLGGFSRDFALAILLVLITLLPLGLRAGAVVMVAVPLSLALGLFLLKLAGHTINQLSIVGFVIALGLLVDDSVVVVENIVRYLREGHTPAQAAVAATKQIAVSVLGCTATLVIAFLPLLALPGTAGQFIRSLPLAVVFTILASLLISLTVVPFLSSRVLKPHGENVFFRGMMRIVEGSYRPLLRVALGFPKSTLLVALGIVIGSFLLVPRIGFSLFPKAGIPQFRVEIETTDGSSLPATDAAARFVEGVLARHPEVKRVATSVGKGHPQVYYNVVPKNESSHYADVFVETDLHDTRDQDRLYATLRGELAGYPGARIELKEFENGAPLDAPVAIRLLGDDAQKLDSASAVVAGLMRAVPGTRNVRDPAEERRIDLRTRIDQERAAQLGVSVWDVDRAVRLAVGGLVAGSYRRDGSDETYPVRLSVPRSAKDWDRDAKVEEARIGGGPRPDLGVLERLYVPSSFGGAVPLAAVATLAFEPSTSTLRHYDKERSITVTADVLPGYNTDRITTAVIASLQSTPLPAGVRFAVGGERESRQESFGGLGTALLVTLFGVIAILVLEFRTFKGTLIVASVIPLGVVGGLAALFLSGYTLSFTASIGFIALMGIEVKNSILLVDFTNQLREEEGLSVTEAIRKAGETRFVPILLTTLTAIGGLVPLVLERSALYSPLALVLTGGLVSSTILARIVTPVLYSLLPPDLERVSEEQPSSLASALDPALAS